jgi:hypothetical protein
LTFGEVVGQGDRDRFAEALEVESIHVVALRKREVVQTRLILDIGAYKVPVRLRIEFRLPLGNPTLELWWLSLMVG